MTESIAPLHSAALRYCYDRVKVTPIVGFCIEYSDVHSDYNNDGGVFWGDKLEDYHRAAIKAGYKHRPYVY